MESTEQAIVREIIEDLTGRSGLGWDDIDEATRDEIRAAWAAIVERHLADAIERGVQRDRDYSQRPEL